MSKVETLLQQGHGSADSVAQVQVAAGSCGTADPAATLLSSRATSLPVGIGNAAAAGAGPAVATATKLAAATGRAVAPSQPIAVVSVAQSPPCSSRATLHCETLFWRKLAFLLDVSGGAAMSDVHVAAWLADAALRSSQVNIQ